MAGALAEHERLVVVDLEATCWSPGSDPALYENQSNEAEIIEIGAVRWPDDGSMFRAVVRPQRHPVLSGFCTQLTGLDQADVDVGLSFPQALLRFLAWAGGDDGLVLGSWGTWDDRQLRREVMRYGLPEPRWRSLNVKRAFSRAAKRHGAPRGGWMDLSTSLAWLGLEVEGTLHRALDDARNAARLWTWTHQHPKPRRAQP